MREFPHHRDAEKAVLPLRANINSRVRSPETVNELIAHYLKYELIPEQKAYSTIEVNGSVLKLYVAPRWGSSRLSAVRTVAVEQWLHSLPHSPATRTKIKAVFSAIFSHAIRHEMGPTQPHSGGALVCKAAPGERYFGPLGVRCLARPVERAGQGDGDAGR